MEGFYAGHFNPGQPSGTGNGAPPQMIIPCPHGPQVPMYHGPVAYGPNSQSPMSHPVPQSYFPGTLGPAPPRPLPYPVPPAELGICPPIGRASILVMPEPPMHFPSLPRSFTIPTNPPQHTIFHPPPTNLQLSQVRSQVPGYHPPPTTSTRTNFVQGQSLAIPHNPIPNNYPSFQNMQQNPSWQQPAFLPPLVPQGVPIANCGIPSFPGEGTEI